MRTLTLKDHVRNGGKDGVSIEKHSTKIYEDQNGFIFYLRRDLDLSPPCFRIFGPITKDFRGIVPDVKINGEIFFGEGLSWKKAEVIFFDIVNKL